MKVYIISEDWGQEGGLVTEEVWLDKDKAIERTKYLNSAMIRPHSLSYGFEANEWEVKE